MSLSSDARAFDGVPEGRALMERQEQDATAQGIRILFNFSRCAGPLTESEGLAEMVKKVCHESGITVLGKVRFKRFPDGTMNSSADLAESHFGLGTYHTARHVAGEINMCHEQCDNTDLAIKFVSLLQAGFRPERAKVCPLPWESD